MDKKGILYVVIILTLTVWAAAASSVWAEDDFSRPEELVSRAQTTFEHFVADPDMWWFRDHVKEAQALFIVPRLIKAGFIFGGTGGSGALVAHDQRTNAWSDPAFYTMAEASFGLQVGAEGSKIIYLVMTERGVRKMVDGKVKLGADMNVAIGPVGGGASVETADVYAFTKSKGAFGGVSAQGGVVQAFNERNNAYYGRSVSPADIVMAQTVKNDGAKGLVSAVSGM